MKTRIGIGALAAGALLLAACGSSDTATPGASGGGGAASPAATSAAASPDAGSASSSPMSPGGSASSGSSAAGSGSGGSPDGSAGLDVEGGAALKLLFGSSGQAETKALGAATQAWGEATDNTVEVTPAQDLAQQLAQSFSSNSAPDLFYVGADQVANYATAGNLLAYGDELGNTGDYYETLKTSFTYDGTFYCAPKDVSTLALFINTDLWAAAGLTDADVPTNWDELAAVAKKLTTDKTVGLSIGPERDRVDAFLVQNGGNLVDDAGAATANSEQNVAALTFVQQMLKDGVLKWPGDLGAGWGGEAFGKGLSAMTIEGNWLLGAMKSDFASTKYTVAELPAGPTGTQGTLSFTNCWGIAATTQHPEQAKALVEYLTAPDQQMEFADAFGVIPSVTTAKDAYLEAFPKNAPFVNGIDYAKGVVSAPGITDVLADFNSQLESLATSDPQAILDSVQENLTAALGG